MSVRRRILHGIGANGFGQAVTLLIQLASVPILIHAWGMELYGEWITVSAIPAYLVMCDIGLSLVAGNSLALLAEKGDIHSMQAIYQSTWVMVSGVTFIVLLVVMGVIWYMVPGEFLGLSLISGYTLQITLLLLFSHVAMSMQTGVLQLPYRVMKKTPVAVVAANMVRLLEWLMATIVVLTEGGVVAVALTFLLVRISGNLVLWMMLKINGSPLVMGVRDANFHTIRTLLRPSLASMCFPLGLSFTLQGFVLLVGGVVGSTGVALFSIYRTFARVPIQVATAINRSVWPELSYAVGANQAGHAGRLVIKMLQFGALLSMLSGFSIYFLGERAIDLWVGHALEHNSLLLMGLTLTTLAHILWQPYWVALMATNKHSVYAGYFLVISALSLILCWIFLTSFGLPGAGYAALLTECLMFIAALVAYKIYFKFQGYD